MCFFEYPPDPSRQIVGVVSIRQGRCSSARLCGGEGCDFECVTGARLARVHWASDGAWVGTRVGATLRRWSIARDKRWGWSCRGIEMRRGIVGVNGRYIGRIGVDDLFDSCDVFTTAEFPLHGQLRLDKLHEFVEFGTFEQRK